MNQKQIIITLFAVFVIGVVGYFALVKNQTPTYQTQQIISASQKECEQRTGKKCFLFQGLCQVMVAQNQSEAEVNEKFLRDCEKKIGTWQPIEEKTGDATNHPVDGIEEGGYDGVAFCSIINHSSFELKDHSITIGGEGPYVIKINEMRTTFPPYEYPNVKLITHLRFENKESSYANTLYFGNDDNLYKCHGGK